MPTNSLSRSNVGLAELELDVNPYPNPEVDKFSFDIPSLLASNLDHSTGQLLKTINPEIEPVVDISEFDSGLFILGFTVFGDLYIPILMRNKQLLIIGLSFPTDSQNVKSIGECGSANGY